jgi:hypothetical protein
MVGSEANYLIGEMVSPENGVLALLILDLFRGAYYYGY